MSSNICIIPARGGSKRIPRKNIKLFLEKPIIAYSIEAALKCGLFEEVMVSTDDQEIEDVALSYGAMVPSRRSAKNSDDFATTLEVLREVIAGYENDGRQFQTICCIYATAPFVDELKLRHSHEVFEKQQYDSMFPIIKYGFPVQRSLSFESGKVILNFPDYANRRSQDLKSFYHDAGQFYWLKREVLKLDNIVTSNTGGYLIDELDAQDIDNDSDWRLAELKFLLKYDRI